MKKYILQLFLCMFLVFQVNAQINKLGKPSLIGTTLSGWYPENHTINDVPTFSLINEGSAVYIKASSSEIALKGKVQQRFTPSVNGNYILHFKAKAEKAGQTISFQIFRSDAWKDLTKANVPVQIESTDYQEYTVDFNDIDATVRDKTPSTFILAIRVDDVAGSLWMDDIRLYEKDDQLIAYEDDFEQDLYYDLYDKNINSWESTAWDAKTAQTVTKEKIGDNTVLQILQNKIKGEPWEENVIRYFWAVEGLKYRIKFDIGASQDFDDFGIEIWCDGQHKIRPTERFNVTTEMKTIDFITGTVTMSYNYKLNFYVGRMPEGAKAYIDNVMISPIHLYDAEVELIDNNKLDIKWKHAGYLANDKMKIELVDENNAAMIIEDNVDILTDGISINLEKELDSNKEYKIRLTDKVAQIIPTNPEDVKAFEIYNKTESNIFVYKSTVEITEDHQNQLQVYALNGNLYIDNVTNPATVQIYTVNSKLIYSIADLAESKSVHLAKGIYIVKIITSAGEYIYKIAL